MSCDCHLEAKNLSQRGALRYLLIINGAMFFVEGLAGVLADSSGVLADSLDMLADALVYGVSLAAIRRGEAVKIRAARWSGWIQIALAVGIAVDVLRRAVLGSEPSSQLMMAVSLVALASNAYCLFLLSKHREGGVHMRASWIFTRSDVIANAGVIVAAILVAVTDTRWPDLVIGGAITVVVVKGGAEILAEAREAHAACSGDRAERAET